jgi:hypothetical protein
MKEIRRCVFSIQSYRSARVISSTWPEQRRINVNVKTKVKAGKLASNHNTTVR